MSELEKIQRDTYQINRKKKIRIQAIVIFALAVALLISFFAFTKQNKETYVAYTEEGNVIHRAYLADNSFYEESYLNGTHAYVASLIEKMTADFSYDLQMATNDVSYQYTYRIDAQVEIKDKASNSPVFNPIYNIVPRTEAAEQGEKLSIQKLIELDYNKYNQIADDFIRSYSLKNTVNTLIVRMYVDVVGMSESFAADNAGEYVIELHVPLLETTVKPSVSTTVPAGEQKIVAKDTTAKDLFMILSIVFASLDVILAGVLAAFVVLTRDKHIDYARKVQRLVSNYKSYIQKILDEYDTSGHQVIRVEAFTELLEIRDTIHQPVFMYENEDRTCTRFFVVTSLKSIYIFEIKVEEEPLDYQYNESTEQVSEEKSDTFLKEEAACEISDDKNESPDSEIINQFGTGVDISCSRSFAANLIQSVQQVKDYYSELKNRILSFKGVKSRMCWRNESFNKGRQQLFKIKIRGKTVCLYCALDPEKFDKSKFFHEAATSKSFASVPMLVRIRSNRGLKKALLLVDTVMQEHEIPEAKQCSTVDYSSIYPYEETAVLVEKGLIKLSEDNSKCK